MTDFDMFADLDSTSEGPTGLDEDANLEPDLDAQIADLEAQAAVWGQSEEDFEAQLASARATDEPTAEERALTEAEIAKAKKWDEAKEPLREYYEELQAELAKAKKARDRALEGLPALAQPDPFRDFSENSVAQVSDDLFEAVLAATKQGARDEGLRLTATGTPGASLRSLLPEAWRLEEAD